MQELNLIQPVILTVSNYSENELKDIELFNALKKIKTNDWRTNSNIDGGQVFVDSGMPGVDYSNLIWNIATGTDIKIGLIHISSIGEIQSAKLKLSYYDIYGSVVKAEYKIERQDNQISKSVIELKQGMFINKTASLLLDSIPANEIYRIYLFKIK